MNWQLYLNFFAAMFAIINPLGIWPMWSELTDDVSRRNVRRDIALLVVITAVGILLVFLISGHYLLKFFSIDIAVFKVAGGILLLYTGISMIQGSATQLSNREEEGDTALDLAKQRFRKIIVPMAIPMLAGPGSITTVVLYGIRAESLTDYAVLGFVVILSFLTLYIVFINSSFLERKVDNTFFNVITRIFGIIVTAIAVQFMVEGLGAVFPSWLEGASVLEEQNGMNQ